MTFNNPKIDKICIILHNPDVIHVNIFCCGMITSTFIVCHFFYPKSYKHDFKICSVTQMNYYLCS